MHWCIYPYVASNLKKTIIILSIFISWHSFSQSVNAPDRILTFGESNYHYRKAREFTAKKWGIELYPATNSFVTQKIVDSVNKVHSKLWKKMDGIHGENSEKRFQKETSAEMKRIIKVQKLFDSDIKVRTMILEIEKVKERTSSNLESISNDGKIYYWTIYSYEKKNNPDYNWVPEFKVGVNLTENKIKIIELD